ncbi:hypothetical protein DEU56DRAFT_920422 [Suillus clintonianus]|uniref:uncharacterized protein n=1 Tax=Suillus clintonianus TaxID=1904413 RepID=UPI001B885ECC|nr:uncharacterized protein DEU56DRAFT_920422 [Suillus clintonianus]KAG2108885.1 hypothetical protein DEU56DRAFT_920422 [Suillus clintonianus]
MKSDSDPESSSALAGLPFMWTTTTTGFGILRLKSLATAALRWSAGGIERLVQKPEYIIFVRRSRQLIIQCIGFLPAKQTNERTRSGLV